MDEMTLLRSLRADIPAADVTREADEAFISRLTAEAANPPVIPHPETTCPLAGWLRRPRLAVDARRRQGPAVAGGSPRWWVPVVAGVVSVAVAIAAGVAAGVAFGPGSSGPAGRPAPAVLLADKAATHAAAQPGVAPGQWVYTKSVNDTTTPRVSGRACAVKDGHGRVHDVPLGPLPAKPGTPCSVFDNGAVVTGNSGGAGMRFPQGQHMAVTGRGTVVAINYPAASARQVEEDWVNADGTRTAHYQGGKLVITGAPGYADLGRLPSDPKALARRMMRPPAGGGRYTTADLAWNAFNGIEGILMGYAVPPKLAAELYRALGDIPGVTVNNDAVDAAGRHGPAFVLTDKDQPGGGWTAEIFLDPRTFQLTGYAEHFPVKCQCPSPGTGETAILRQAVVSGPGIRP